MCIYVGRIDRFFPIEKVVIRLLLFFRQSFLLCMEKNLLVNFTIFIKKFIIFLVTLGHTQNLGFLLF